MGVVLNLTPKSRRAVIAVGLALVIAVMFWRYGYEPSAATRSDGGSAQRSVSPSPARHAESRRAERGTTVDAAEPTDAAGSAPVPPSASEPGVRIRVRVLRADGAPAANVRVALLEHTAFCDGFGAKEAPPSAESARATTGPEGDAVLETATGGVDGGRVVAWEGEDAAASDRGIYAKPGAELDVALRLARAFRVRGTVVDSSGRRVETARVRMIVSDVMSSMSSSIGPYGYAIDPVVMDHGHFEFAPVTQVDGATGFVLDVRAEGFLVGVFAEENEVAERGEVTLRLQRSRVVTGRIVGAGTPIEGARVAAPRGAVPRAVLYCVDDGFVDSASAADGRFRLEGVSEDAFEILATAEGWALRKFPVPAAPAAESDVGEIVLEFGDVLRGDVSDADGKPAPAAHLGWQSSRLWAQAESDALGRFTIEHVPRGAIRIIAWDDGGPDWCGSSASLAGVVPDGTPIHITLSGARLLRIDLDYESGSELPSDPPYHHITATPAGGGDTVLDVWPRGKQHVRYKFDRPGAYDLVVELPGWETVRQRVDVSATAEVRVPIRLRLASR